MNPTTDILKSKLEWRHVMAYGDFLDAVIEHELKRMEKWSKLDRIVFDHGYRALSICKGKDYKRINDMWHAAVKRHKIRLRSQGVWRHSWTVASDIYQVNLGFVLQCLSVAYGIKRKDGFIQPQAVDLANKILKK